MSKNATMLFRILIAVMILTVLPGGNYLFGQEEKMADSENIKSNLVRKKMAVSDTILLDTFAILKHSVQIENIPQENYVVDGLNSFILWKNKPDKDSIEISYRYLPIRSFSFPMYNKSPIQYNQWENEAMRSVLDYQIEQKETDNFVHFDALQYQGVYARSMAIGNQQSMALNSNFNMQVNGYILDSIRIEAALTDNTMPIQPDGNTQQLNEFDQVFITFEKNKYKLTAGDYAIQKTKSHFLHFNKRLQGLMFESEFSINKNIENKLKLSGSIAKGQFARNVFEAAEGNQGPYKLQGNNNEQFFIVLSNSEKVYIDGLLVERGEDRDYVINYNTGEITFMPRQLITKDKRIQIEFEYQDRNYLNSLIFIEDELIIGKKLRLRWNVYSNQDAKNQSYMQNLTAQQTYFLTGLGDKIDEALYPTLQQDTFAPNKILYHIRDSMYNGNYYDTIFVYAANGNEPVYSVGFSFVGEKQGSYIISEENTNGRSYTWIAPDDEGNPMGNYAPVTLLITPKKHQVFSMGINYALDSFKNIDVEIATSNYNPNTFSSIDNHKHQGYAGRLKYEETRYFGKKDRIDNTTKNTWKNHFNYEFADQQFRAIAPYRHVEFNRDWNVDSNNLYQDEHWVSYETELKKYNLGKITYQLSYLNRGADAVATRNIGKIVYDRNQMRTGIILNLMNSQSSLLNSKFFRPSAFVERQFQQLSNLTLGAKYEKEHNDRRFIETDTLLPSAFSFDILNAYLRSRQDAKWQFEVNYTHRNDKASNSKQFVQHNHGHTIDGSLELKHWQQHQLSFTGGYRRLFVSDTSISNLKAGESVVGRLNYHGNIKQGFIIPSLMYELGTGQEQKREFVYVEVPPGQGLYMWVDYNQDGLQQANEFELGIYPDQKKFIKIMTLTNEYVKVNYIHLNHSLIIDPDRLWAREEKRGWRKIITLFANQLSLNIQNRSLTDAGFQTFNPFARSIQDENIISNISSLSNTLFLNRRSAVWGAEYTHAYNSGKSLLTYGIEKNTNRRNELKARWMFSKGLTFNINATYGNRSYYSGLEDGRTHDINFKSIDPSLTWLLQSKIRITTGYKYDYRFNTPTHGDELANIHSFNLDSRLSFRDLGSLILRSTYANIQYSGEDNTSISFVMLDALKKGSNWLWYLNWERRLGSGIEISLEYEGRKPGKDAAIHTGRMSIRAIL